MANFEFVTVPSGMEGCVPCALCRNRLVFEAAEYFVKLLEGRCVDLEKDQTTFKVDLNESRGCFVCQKHAIVILRKAMPSPICEKCHMKPRNMDPLLPVLVHDLCMECQAEIMIRLHYVLIGDLDKFEIASATLNIVTLTCEDGYLCGECADTADYIVAVVKRRVRSLKMHPMYDVGRFVCRDHAISLLRSAMAPVEIFHVMSSAIVPATSAKLPYPLPRDIKSGYSIICSWL